MLSAKQEKVLAALLSSGTQREAAKKAGVAETTVGRYLKEPEFEKAYKAAADKLFATAFIQSEKALNLAFETLTEICGSKAENGQVRVSAARSIIEYSLKMKEICDIEGRIERLEQSEGNNEGFIFNTVKENRETGSRTAAAGNCLA